MKITTLIAALFIIINLSAQNGSEAELYKTFLKAEKKAVVAENMNLTNQDAAIFWKIYDEYMLERSKLSQNKGELAEYYLQNIENSDPKAIDTVVKAASKNKVNDAKLMKKYYYKIKKGLNEEIALRFYMVEEQLQLLLKSTMYQELPIINAHPQNK